VETTTREAFQARCAQVAAIVTQSGATVSKAPKEFAVVVARDGASVSFPIVTDERDWRETSAEEALFAALTDLYAWASAKPNETSFATLDAIEKGEVPFVSRDLSAELERLRAFAGLVGGIDTVRRAWRAAGIDAADGVGLA
jgi:hypothetical protein